MKTTVISANNIHSANIVDKLQSPQGFFSADEMINAYEKGCNDGFSKQIKKMKRELYQNITLATTTAEEFLKTINSKDNICSSIFLRVIDVNQFDLLYAINEDVFFDTEKSKPFYLKSMDFEDNNPAVSISFVPNLDTININRLAADNYLFFYGKKQSN